MLRRVVDFVYGTYVERSGTVQCAVRWFLDQRFRAMDFDKQLQRVWITQARLCSLEKSGGRYREPNYRLCQVDYLEAQLRLLRGVPVVAFGGKAKRVLRSLGVAAIDAPHPSKRVSKESKRRDWEHAIALLEGRGQPRSSTQTPTGQQREQKPASGDRAVHGRATTQGRPQAREGVPGVTVEDLPDRVGAFLVAAANAGYDVRLGNRQNISVLYEGRWLGGWNYKAMHWYVRDSSVGERTSLPTRHRFEPRRHGTIWQRSGKEMPTEATDAFRSVIEELTHVPIRVPD